MTLMRPVLPESNILTTWDFDPFTPPREQGVTADGTPMPWRETHVVFVTQTQIGYPITPGERRLLEAADGERTVHELLEHLDAPEAVAKQRVFDFVRRGVLVVPLTTSGSLGQL